MKSNLTIEQQKLVRTPAFKKWFGDWENAPETASKVVGSNGEPLVVYHTTDKDFTVFDKRKSREGLFFSPNKERLSVYGKSKISSFFLNLRNPSHELFKIDIKYLISKGYDGIMDYGHARKVNEDLYEIIAFYTNQMKLADGTNTTFDNKTSDIRFGGGGSIKSKGTFNPLGTAKELGIKPKISGHDMIAECDCGEKFSYQNSKKDILWQCPECDGMKRITTS